MLRVLLIQLPVPQANFGRQTGNVPLAAAWLSRAAAALEDVRVEILPESVASYLGDAALIETIVSRSPGVVGFSVFCWNVERSLHLARQVRQRTGARVVLGGPEVTPDNPLLADAPVDFQVYGEGEEVFKNLLADSMAWGAGKTLGTPGGFFSSSPSPYLAGLLEPEIGNLMMLETQRGCPFGCGYCAYGKGRRRVAAVAEPLLLAAVDWALEQGIAEIYLLDPCLDARPGLRAFLEKLAACNRQRRVGFVSEIRAESVDAPLADLFQAAGFGAFEIGLQSTHPAALALMNRPTDLKRFLHGARLLQERGITPRIDLILGLPGDDLQSFQRSVDFVADHDLADDVQVFPLSVLPGTDFRRRDRVLGLRYAPKPPYPVIETATFSQPDLLRGVEYAEARFDTALYPFAAPDIAWKRPGAGKAGDVWVDIGGTRALAKLYLDGPRPAAALEDVADRLTHPYQIFVAGTFDDEEALGRCISVLSAANPFTPFEIVFLAPERPPRRRLLLAAVRLRRPHFLDLEQRFLYPRPGNRAVILTLVSPDRRRSFDGSMERQIFWWQAPGPPTRRDLDLLEGLDGVLVDPPLPQAALAAWQDRWAGAALELVHICFADLDLQRRWLLMTPEGRYVSRMPVKWG